MTALMGNDVKYEVIVTSNVVTNSLLVPKYIFSYPELFDEAETDNSAIILMTLLARLGTQKIALAGFDGYRDGSNNYYSESVSLGHASADNETIKIGLALFIDTKEVQL